MRNIERVENWSNGKKTPPLIAQFHLTNRCNLMCKFCGISFLQSNTYELPDVRWMKITEDFCEMGIKKLTISGGGEPMIRSKLVFEIIKKIKKYDINGEIITNGTLFNYNDAKEIVDIGLDSILFSVHSSEEKISDFLRGKNGSLKNTVETIKMINEANKGKNSENISLGLIAVITKYNCQEIEKIIEFAREFGLNKVNLRMVNEDVDVDTKSLFMKEDQLPIFISSMEKASELAKEYNIKFNLDFSVEHLKKYFYGLPSSGNDVEESNTKSSVWCSIPFSEMVVFADGRCSQCCNFVGVKNEEIIDNIIDKNPSEIWYGDRFEELRNRVIENNPPNKCIDCTLDFMKDNKNPKIDFNQKIDIRLKRILKQLENLEAQKEITEKYNKQIIDLQKEIEKLKKEIDNKDDSLKALYKEINCKNEMMQVLREELNIIHNSLNYKIASRLGKTKLGSFLKKNSHDKKK